MLLTLLLQREEEVSNSAVKTFFMAKVKRGPILRFIVTVAGADLACRTPEIAPPQGAKELATSCESPFV